MRKVGFFLERKQKKNTHTWHENIVLKPGDEEALKRYLTVLKERTHAFVYT